MSTVEQCSFGIIDTPLAQNPIDDLSPRADVPMEVPQWLWMELYIHDSRSWVI